MPQFPKEALRRTVASIRPEFSPLPFSLLRLPLNTFCWVVRSCYFADLDEVWLVRGDLNLKMLTPTIFIEKHRFSIAIFFICLFEALFWSLPMLESATPVSVVENRELAQYLTNNLVVFDEGDLSSVHKNRPAQVLDQYVQEIMQEESTPAHNGKESATANVAAAGTVGVLSTLAALVGIQRFRTLDSNSDSSSSSSSHSSNDTSSASGASAKKSSGPSASVDFAASVVPSTTAASTVVVNKASLPAATGGNEVVQLVADRLVVSGPAPGRGTLHATTSEVAPANSRVDVNTTLDEKSGAVRSGAGLANEFADMAEEEIVALVENGTLSPYNLEDKLEDYTRAVSVRRKVLAKSLDNGFDINAIPYENYEYENVKDKCCENVIGYLPIPIGVVGPITINGKPFKVPMATTEGCLVASTHRGMKAIDASGGASSTVTAAGMSRGPCVRMPNAKRAAELKMWLESDAGKATIAQAFNSTSRFARLKSLKVNLAGRNVYARFTASTGDAMGMNMISKGVEKGLEAMQAAFPDLEIVAISGNFCTDKKPSAGNWILGRGRSVVADATIKGEVVTKVLKTTVQALVDVNISKNLVGSAIAGSIGGFNAHASNILTAVFLATGQDPAQNVESSNCITLMEAVNAGKDLYISVTMPSIEVGTIGGGTQLPAQAACLEMLGCKGADKTSPGRNADTLAQVIAVAVLAGELSLMSAIAAGQLVRAHMALNRGKQHAPGGVVATTASASEAPATPAPGAAAAPAAKAQAGECEAPICRARL